jgi:cysteine synthase B
MSTPAKPNGQREMASGLGETLGHTLAERIGNTPLLRLDALTRDLPGIALLGKAEWYNPGGSVKDRAAANIVAEARRSGKLMRCSAPRRVSR